MSNFNQRSTPRATSKWLFFYQAKIVALAYAISLIPLPVRMAHAVAVEGFVLWLLISAIYTVWYRRRGGMLDVTEYVVHDEEVNLRTQVGYLPGKSNSASSADRTNVVKP